MDTSSSSHARSQTQSESPFVALVSDQSLAIIPTFTLESGVVMKNIPLAYTTRGRLSPERDNAMIICHALTGSADVVDWWGPLLGGPGRALDVSRFYVVCINCLGSPYGSASPVTYKDGEERNGRYGPEFPLTTIRDDVNISKVLLDMIGINRIAVVIGGSMGGMSVLEWAYLGPEYVRCIIPIATSSQHSAWGISWGEAQRQSIYADPKYNDGYYPFEDPPTTGLGAARMSALLTYRSRNSFEARFGRAIPDASKKQTINDYQRPSTPSQEHWAIHNDGHKGRQTPLSRTASGAVVRVASDVSTGEHQPAQVSQVVNASTAAPSTQSSNGAATQKPGPASTYFSAQSYLRYQGNKFVSRFDANCYIAITRKLDTHDVSRHRVAEAEENPIAAALAMIKQPTMVIGIESDGLFTFGEQQELAAYIPDARLRRIESPEGHDAFLLQFEQVNRHILEFLHEVLPDIMTQQGTEDFAAENVGAITKDSTFGEAEVDDITAW